MYEWVNWIDENVEGTNKHLYGDNAIRQYYGTIGDDTWGTFDTFTGALDNRGNRVMVPVRVSGKIMVPHGKVDYMFGGAEEFTDEDYKLLKFLQEFKNINKDLCDTEELDRLERKHHNFERSSTMLRDLTEAGIVKSSENMRDMLDRLVESGDEAVKILNESLRKQDNMKGAKTSFVINGTRKSIEIDCRWKFVKKDIVRLDGVVFSYLGTVITKLYRKE
jgi:hypothetical protein